MSLYKFGPNDIFYNRVKTHPRCSFFIYGAKIYYNNQVSDSGSFSPTAKNVPSGHLNLYEINIDKEVGKNSYIYPFITKEGAGNSLSTISTTTYNNTFAYGDEVTGSYPFSASISREYFQLGSSRSRINTLQNTLNYYTPLSDHYAYSSSLGLKASQSMGLISIPSIFYGSSIKKGSVRLKFYITGTLAAELNDNKYNGELVQISGSDYAQTNGSGSVAGVVLYNEGFIVLTGSWALESTARDYIADLTDLQTSSWQYFGAGANDGINPSSGTTLHSASFELVFEGTNYVPTITMLAHAPKGHLNYSNNPTYVKYKQSVANDNPILHPVSSSKSYVERKDLRIENTISSSYPDPTGSLKKQTFISKIGIYDDDMNLLGIASVAKPVKKLEERDFTFKLKYDI